MRVQALKVDDFPAEFQKKAGVLLNIRKIARRASLTHHYFVFDELTTSQRKAWTNVLLELYEALLLDIGRARSEE
ncbi:MAG: hypothetical protein HY246_06485 [Proteobacteria bacterium]|nr:hypothetical protein [Pseudomonadota bacterium]